MRYLKDRKLKRIRQAISSPLTFFVNSVILIFRAIEEGFKRTSSFSSYFDEFLIDHKRSIKEGLIALLICACGDLVAGMILGKMTYFLETFPGLLVLIPGAIGMRGNIFGSFSSRLSTNLHIGILTPEFKQSETLTNNIQSSLVLTLILSLFLAALAKGLCMLLGYPSMSFIDFTLISVIAGLISNVIMLPITMFVSLKSFENGWDPDNITTPIIAAFGDLFTLPAIIGAILILNFLGWHYILKFGVFIVLLIIIVVSFISAFKGPEDLRRIVRQSTPILFVCSILGVVAGGIFNGSLTTLLTNTSLLTLVPLFSGESGSLVSILGARISSSLHSGLIEPILKPKKNVLYNFLLCIILGIVVYPLIGVLSDISSYLIGGTGMGLDKIIEISSASGFILLPLMMMIVFYVSTISYRRGLDPDNIVIPITTSITDSISSLILITISLIFTGAIVF